MIMTHKFMPHTLVCLASLALLLWTRDGPQGALAFAPVTSPPRRPLTTRSIRHASSKPPIRTLSLMPLRASLSPLDDDEKSQNELSLPQLEEERWESDSKVVELVGLAMWLTAVSAFILVNNFVGPWPTVMTEIPERVFFLGHMLGGMLFGGGIILTTAIEWLVAKNKNVAVLQFWFDKVPLLDAVIVLPALTLSMLSGTGLSIQRYGGLGHAPVHVNAIFYALLAFCSWWAFTDLTTQGSALIAVNEMIEANNDNDSNEKTMVPNVVDNRHLSNVVSCLFVITLYAIMVMKPGTLFKFP